MADFLTKEQRSHAMRQVGRQHTGPELVVRSTLHKMGYRFRLHCKDLAGSPDIVLPRHNVILFVNGCFWHGHRGCRRAKRPATNKEYWNRRIDGNVRRDRRVQRKLRRQGWSVGTVWECQTFDVERLQRRLTTLLGN